MAELTESLRGKFTGLTVGVSGLGKAELTQRISKNQETEVYSTSRPGILVKVFDLDCGKPDEVSFGPYTSFNLELANFQFLQQIETLRVRVPTFYGSSLDAARKFAYIVMEHLQGDNLLAWSAEAAAAGYPDNWPQELRATLYETLGIIRDFHAHGIVLIDFKPDNVIRLHQGGVKFVDLGSLLTPQQGAKREEFLYAATPDYSELVIDTSNVQAGMALTQGSDIFAAGVALFELANGESRLSIAPDNADQMLARPGIFRFRDTQIRDVWRAYPHLISLLPLIETQLKERRLLFSEFWHLLKGYLSMESPDWETCTPEEQRDQLLSTGTAFIGDQLPEKLQWLAAAIVRSTTLRGYRVKSVPEVMELIADPVSKEIEEDLEHHNQLLQFSRDLDPPLTLRQPFNSWEVRQNPKTGHWGISGPLAASQLISVTSFTFLKETHRDEWSHRYYQLVGDTEADETESGKLTLDGINLDSFAWIGG